jgi:Tol biopolymer transport system component
MMATVPSAQAAFPGDNGKLAFVKGFDIYTANPDGTGLMPLTSTAAQEARPAWSPNGTRIAFAADYSGQWDIYVMNADGGGVTRLTTDPALDYSPDWSPDGTKLVFASSRGSSSTTYRDLYTMSADGSSQNRLTTHLSNESDYVPAWSPDGTRIAFERGDSGRGDRIYTIKPDGSDLTLIAAQGEPGCWLDESWSPDWSRPARGWRMSGTSTGTAGSRTTADTRRWRRSDPTGRAWWGCGDGLCSSSIPTPFIRRTARGSPSWRTRTCSR